MAKKKNEISVGEFKSWIAGIQDMQESGWAPNKQQWEKIRSKIEQLVDTEVVETVQYQQPVYQQPVEQQYHHHQPVYQQPQWPIEQPSSVDAPISPITYSSGEAAQFI
jgi:hypothetical protein